MMFSGVRVRMVMSGLALTAPPQNEQSYGQPRAPTMFASILPSAALHRFHDTPNRLASMTCAPFAKLGRCRKKGRSSAPPGGALRPRARPGMRKPGGETPPGYSTAEDFLLNGHRQCCFRMLGAAAGEGTRRGEHDGLRLVLRDLRRADPCVGLARDRVVLVGLVLDAESTALAELHACRRERVRVRRSDLLGDADCARSCLVGVARTALAAASGDRQECDGEDARGG